MDLFGLQSQSLCKFSIFLHQSCKNCFRNIPPNDIPIKILLEVFVVVVNLGNSIINPETVSKLTNS